MASIICRYNGMSTHLFVTYNLQVLGNAWAAHHDARFWDEPWEYRPERFLDDQGELLPADHVTRKK